MVDSEGVASPNNELLVLLSYITQAGLNLSYAIYWQNTNLKLTTPVCYRTVNESFELSLEERRTDAASSSPY